MGSITHQFYFRAMSVWEYQMWQEANNSKKGITKAEWIADERRGYGLPFLVNKWVNPGYQRTRGDRFAIITGVRARAEDGFFEIPLITPLRYTHLYSIDFKRLTIVHDPRASVLSEARYIDLSNPTELLR